MLQIFEGSKAEAGILNDWSFFNFSVYIGELMISGKNEVLFIRFD